MRGSLYAPFRPRPYVGQSAPMTAPEPRPAAQIIGLTLLGAALFGGGGALVGWLVGRTQQAALIGALVGISAPPAASALLYMQQGQGGRSG